MSVRSVGGDRREISVGDGREISVGDRVRLRGAGDRCKGIEGEGRAKEKPPAARVVWLSMIFCWVSKGLFLRGERGGEGA